MYKVIIVDDEKMIKRSLAVMIEHLNVNFEIAGEADDGREALELISRVKPDLVITDIRMPVLDGIQLLGEIKKMKNNIETIVVSGYDEFEYAQQAIRLGATDYLLKPIKIDSVNEALQRVYHKLESKSNKENSVNHMETAEKNLAHSPKIVHVVKVLEEQYANENLSLQNVAEFVELSPSYLSRIFKEEMGESFISYLTRLRMEKAQSLLKDPYNKSYEVSTAVGYIDYPHFSKAFKKHLGISPSEYRKKAGIAVERMISSGE